MKTEHEAAVATEGPKTAAKTKRASARKKTAKPAIQKASKATTPKTRVAKAGTSSATKKATRPATGKKEARADTKKAIVLELLRRKEGATMAEIAKATDWQNHSIRGFISGQVTKKMGLKVESAKNDADQRTYRITQ